MSEIPVLGRLREADGVFEASWGYASRSRLKEAIGAAQV